MKAFNIHRHITSQYTNYLKSFTNIRDKRIQEKIQTAFDNGEFLPKPLIQFNPAYRQGQSLTQLASEGVVHQELPKLFGGYNLYEHQIQALQKGVDQQSFMVTSGTGSGKSLTYMATIFNRLLKETAGPGVRAILVYPMNALINSQVEEIRKYAENYGPDFPIQFRRYTGQESKEEREEIERIKPQIILTNYMMLELIMTRDREHWMRESMQQHLQFLVFDELHTYRGRQGADVSLLIRRIKQETQNQLICIGTSATMASGTSPTEKKREVAKVATQIFGQPFNIDQIIGETLDTCTISTSLPSPDSIRQAIQIPIDTGADADIFRKHPLAIWLENSIALSRHADGALERGRPLPMEEITSRLTTYTLLEMADCHQALLTLLAWAEVLNIKGSRLKPRQAHLPFKIHQFIGQTGNVYVTLDDRDERIIQLETDRYVKIDGVDKPLFSVLFSRYSGHDFICVRKDLQAGYLLPRDPNELPLRGDEDELDESGISPYGYLILADGEEDMWSVEDIDELPDTWFKVTKKGGRELKPQYRNRLPRPIYFNNDGEYSDDVARHLPNRGWYMPAKLLFDPTAGVVFDLKTNENTKLMRIGNEGRSTATTVVAFNTLRALQQEQIPARDQKLLSFTDNRQDASLQAGHFNDFLVTGRLRSAIYQALLQDAEKQLTIDSIAHKVYEVLALPESEYAKNPSDPEWPDPKNEKALKEFLLIRILYDLKRGWRYNTPNLEQCGLLQIGYSRLENFVAVESKWQSLPLFSSFSPNDRFQAIMQILNFFRTSYAFDHPKLLSDREATEERLRLLLNDQSNWSLDKNEKIEVPYLMVIQSVGQTPSQVFTASIGPNSYLGKYLRRLYRKAGLIAPKGAAMASFIEEVCAVLKKGNFLTTETIRGGNGLIEGYRLRLDNVIWTLGDGQSVLADEVRIAHLRNTVTHRPNAFFRDFYQQDFRRFEKPLLGREHTGQLGHDDREDREKAFRSGDISALFCSPTMELGIDIADLNVVHMRNVPPNPANYTQRSGRAGRSGQAALVFTYCSNGSPHDRHYFRNSAEMVAGVVSPPKIDLTNEELIAAHFNAYILKELRLKDLQMAVSDVLETSDLPKLPLKASIRDIIADQVERYADKWVRTYQQLLQQVPELNQTDWYNTDWLQTRAIKFCDRFNDSFERWRVLYRNAEKMIQQAQIILTNPTFKSSSDERKQALNDQRTGLRQRDLLLNDTRKSAGNESEFYVFRYLASEGFLPGYNFTRLPVRVFLGRRQHDEGQFVSRPRFIALKEFGPLNVIYHNGSKYRVGRMISLSVADSLRGMTICKDSGYAFLDDEGKGINHDPISNNPLQGQSSVEVLNGKLLELAESEALPLERISCEEEERTGQGFEIDNYFSFPKGIEHTKRIQVKEADQPLLSLIYGRSARLIQLNRRWRINTKDPGFTIGTRTGRWKRSDDENTQDPNARVHIFATDTADVLYIQPIANLGLMPDGVTTLAFALKRSIELCFQVEEKETGVWVLGQGDHTNIMLFESAEGSLGVLSKLAESGKELNRVFRKAYQLLHFDLTTRQDAAPDKPRASYDDLLSYYNQRYHEQLDRYAVKVALEKLIDCTSEPMSGPKSYKDQSQVLILGSDPNASTEKPLVQYLKKHGFRLPDRFQVNIPGYYINADFVYDNDYGSTLIFCDGTVHDLPEVQEKDRRKRQVLYDAGYDVIEWHYSEPIHQLVERRKDIFRKVI
jgi:superfamily II DNA/RNA helicase